MRPMRWPRLRGLILEEIQNGAIQIVILGSFLTLHNVLKKPCKGFDMSRLQPSFRFMIYNDDYSQFPH